MRVMIDGLNLSLSKGTGVSTYARNLANLVGELGHDVEILFAVDIRRDHEDLLKEVYFFEGRDNQSIKETRYARPLSKLFTLCRALLGRLSAQKIPVSGKVESRHFASKLPNFDELWNCPDVFLVAFLYFKLTGRFLTLKFSSPPDIAHWTYPIPIKIAGARNIYTIHDLVPLKAPFSTLDDKHYYYKLCKKIVADADAVVTVSENSKEDICEILDTEPKNVFNTSQSISIPEAYTSVPLDELTQILNRLYRLEYGEYFLFVGAIEPKKNIPRLLEAYLGTDIDIPLVLAGPDGWLAEQELAIWRSRSTDSHNGAGQTTHRVVRIDYLPFSNLVNLIRGAKYLVSPSLYEGFGLPVLEAMTLGTPVITSNTSSLPEIAGDTAITVDPYDVSDIRRALLQAVIEETTGDRIEQLRLQASRFSPDAVKASLMNMYREVAAGRPRHRADVHASRY